jgi:hypothetical protein
MGMESPLEWLVRVRWLSNQGGSVNMTELGRAVLRHLDEQELSSELAGVIELDPDDEVVYARVIEGIARYDDAMLVDAYLDFESLNALVTRTSVTRVLTSNKGNDASARMAGLGTVLSGLWPDRELELRLSGQMHDRYVIPPDGPIAMISTSLSGVGKRPTVMISIRPPAADHIRSTHEDIWDSAEPMQPTSEG